MFIRIFIISVCVVHHLRAASDDTLLIVLLKFQVSINKSVA